MMKTIEIQIPDQFEIDNNELNTFLAVKLFEVAKLTLGQAAEMTGVSIEEFISILFKYNVSVINYPASDLELDVKNAEESIRRHQQLNFSGTLGVLIVAKKLGYINKIKPLLDKINLTDFRLSSDIQAKALLLAGE